MKKFAWLLLSFFTIFSFVSCKKRILRVNPVTVYQNLEEDGTVVEDIILENEYLSLRFLPETAAIILTDKASGARWHSNPKGNAVDIDADVITSYLMDSQFSLEYSDTTGVAMTLYSGQSSILLKAYEYEVVNGVLEVRYTIGDNVRTFRIPPALTEERMDAYLEKMEDREQGIVDASYRLYDINNLRSNDDQDALLANYPDLAKTNVYVLRDNAHEYMKELMEEFFANVGYTYNDYMEDAEKYPTASGMNKPAFNLTLRYILDGKSLVVNAPFDQIAYRPNFPFRQLTLLPFMGSGSVHDEGFMLVPDGSGSLINFNNGKFNQVPFSVVVYGWDEAMPRDAVISDSKAPFPGFGIQKNGAALFCVIEEGASYASVRADVSGRNASWNRVYAYFDIVHGTSLDIVGRNERNVYVFENGLPDGESITLRYTPCSSPGYVGMAKEYRSWLQKKYPQLGQTKIDDTPIAVEIVGAVNKTQHRLGIPFDLPLKLTSYVETESMINDFAMFGWKNVQIKLNGWFNRSVDHSVPTKIKLIKELGKKKDFRNLVSAAEKNNYKLYPEVDFVFMRDVKQFSGFSLYRDAARSINRERVQRYPFSFVWFGERKMWGKLNYLSRPAATIRMIDNYVPKAAKLGIKNIAFRSIGSRLAGDYHEKRHVSREASIKIRQEKLAELQNAGTGVLVNTGFDFAVPFASVITDMMIDDQYFGITDTAVPFYQIALHGLVPFTGKAINLAEDYTKNLLKSVEGGAGLYFSFMKEETSELQETKFRQFYANEYDKWVGDADALYKRFSADFGKLYSQAIVDHRILSPGVTVTVYQDGTEVVVNISDNDWTYRSGGSGLVVKANSYSVVK
ncbi:MAG: DUF5696 domain-containing protein [Treponema sp.]|nr:DUF5696 domain-containing protein [Treponema sp.]